jgi:hypothetical protein
MVRGQRAVDEAGGHQAIAVPCARYCTRVQHCIAGFYKLQRVCLRVSAQHERLITYTFEPKSAYRIFCKQENSAGEGALPYTPASSSNKGACEHRAAAYPRKLLTKAI